MGMDMNKLLGEMQQMQEQMAKAQEELASQTVEATAGGGMVTVKATGALEIVEIKIDPKAIDPDDPELLADMIQAAANEAIRSAQALMEQRLGGLAGGALGASGSAPDLNFGLGPQPAGLGERRLSRRSRAETVCGARHRCATPRARPSPSATFRGESTG